MLGVTEFSRTVRANGTGGTDHGTASAVLLAGPGAVEGIVHGDWPGLARTDSTRAGSPRRPTCAQCSLASPATGSGCPRPPLADRCSRASAMSAR